MPQFKIDVTEVVRSEEFAGRSVDVHVEDRVRGAVVIRMNEDEARWMFAELAPMVARWRREDGDTTD